MDDLPLVRVLHGFAQGGKQLEPRVHGQPARVAPLVDRFAFDVFHCEPVCAIGGDAAVEQSGNVGVVERCENPAFLDEPPQQVVIGRQPAPHELQRDTLREVCLAFGEVDDAHAAATDLAKDTIRPDAERHARWHGLRRVGRQCGCDVSQGCGEERVVALAGIDQREYFGAKGLVITARVSEPDLAIGSRDIEGSVHEPLDPFPALPARLHATVNRPRRAPVEASRGP